MKVLFLLSHISREYVFFFVFLCCLRLSGNEFICFVCSEIVYIVNKNGHTFPIYTQTNNSTSFILLYRRPKK